MRAAAGLVGLSVALCAAVADAQPAPQPTAAPSAAPAPPASSTTSAPPTAPAPSAAQPGPPPAPPPASGQPQYPPGYGPQQRGYAPPGYPYYYYYPGYYQQQPTQLAQPVPKKRRSTAMMVGGILMTAGGAASLIAGAALYGSSKDAADVYCDDGTGPILCTTKDDVGRGTAGVIMMIGGGLGVAVGIPLWVIGGKMIPIKEAPSDESPQPPKSARPEFRVGPGSAAMRWRF